MISFAIWEDRKSQNKPKISRRKVKTKRRHLWNRNRKWTWKRKKINVDHIVIWKD